MPNPTDVPVPVQPPAGNPETGAKFEAATQLTGGRLNTVTDLLDAALGRNDGINKTLTQTLQNGDGTFAKLSDLVARFVALFKPQSENQNRSGTLSRRNRAMSALVEAMTDRRDVVTARPLRMETTGDTGLRAAIENFNNTSRLGRITLAQGVRLAFTEADPNRLDKPVPGTFKFSLATAPSIAYDQQNNLCVAIDDALRASGEENTAGTNSFQGGEIEFRSLSPSQINTALTAMRRWEAALGNTDSPETDQQALNVLEPILAREHVKPRMLSSPQLRRLAEIARTVGPDIFPMYVGVADQAIGEGTDFRSFSATLVASERGQTAIPMLIAAMYPSGSSEFRQSKVEQVTKALAAVQTMVTADTALFEALARTAS